MLGKKLWIKGEKVTRIWGYTTKVNLQ